MLPNTMRHDVHAGAERLRDAVHAAVVDGLLERPRPPHGLDRAPQLLHADPSGTSRPVALRTSALYSSTSLRSASSPSSESVSTPSVRRLAPSSCSKRAMRDAEHDVGVHLDEAAIRVVGEARVAARAAPGPSTVRSLRPRLRIVSIMPGIETRRRRAHRDEQRVRRIAEASCRSLPRAARGCARPPRAARRARCRVAQVRRCRRRHAIVKPGGTGTPRLVISARFAPLPPSTVFMSFVPSAAAVAEEVRPSRTAAWPLHRSSARATSHRAVTSAPAAEAELVRVGGWRRGVVAGEAGMAEAIRARRARSRACRRATGSRANRRRGRRAISSSVMLAAISSSRLRRVDAVVAGARDRAPS